MHAVITLVLLPWVPPIADGHYRQGAGHTILQYHTIPWVPLEAEGQANQAGWKDHPARLSTHPSLILHCTAIHCNPLQSTQKHLNWDPCSIVNCCPGNTHKIAETSSTTSFHPQDISKIFQRYPQDKPKICQIIPRYPPDIPEILARCL